MNTIKDFVLGTVDGMNQEEKVNYLENACVHGCISGCVSELIYYTDTIEFYDKFKNEIFELIEAMNDDFGYNIIPTLNGYDDSDPLIRETYNKNLLAWFAYESVAAQILIDWETENL